MIQVTVPNPANESFDLFLIRAWLIGTFKHVVAPNVLVTIVVQFEVGGFVEEMGIVNQITPLSRQVVLCILAIVYVV